MQAPTAAGNPSNLESARELTERLRRLEARMGKGATIRTSGEEGVESLRSTSDRLREMLKTVQERQAGERAGPSPPITRAPQILEPGVLSQIGLELGEDEAARIAGITGMDGFMTYLRDQNAPRGVIDVFNNQEIANAINAGMSGESLSQIIARVALSAGQNVQDVMGYASPYLLSLSPPTVRAAASNLRSAEIALSLGIHHLPRASAWRRPAETLRRGVGMLMAGAPYVGAYMLVEQGMKGLKELFNYNYHNKEKINEDDMKEFEAAMQLEAALRQFEDDISEAPDDPYAEENVQTINNMIFQAPNYSSYTIQQKQDLEMQYNDSVMSALKQRLANVIADRLPKAYFSTGAMRRRAVEPVLPMSMWANEGYPPKII